MHTAVIPLLKSMGFATVSEDYYDLISYWRAWYRGSVADFHEYKVFNGVRHVHCHKLTAGMAKTVSENWADLIMNDKVVITLEGSAEQAFFDAVCERNRFHHMMNRYQELAFALGTVAIVARVEGMRVDADGVLTGAGSSVVLDYVPADGIFPLSWVNGRVIECAFATTRVHVGKTYLYLQLHLLDQRGNYIVENRLYLEENGCLTEQPLETVPALSSVAPVFHTGSPEPLFVIDTPNIANNLAPDVPLGVSVYANAIDQLKNCDNVFDSMNSEFTLGRKRVMVKPEAVRNIDGEPLFDPNDLVFYILPEDSQNGSFVNEISAALRVEEHETGLQLALDMLSLRTGFGCSHWQFDAGHITTATQVISANSDEYRTQKKHELVLEQVLIELARLILRLGNDFLGLRLNENVEISVDFDESVIEDKASEFTRDCKMLELGVLGRDEFRAKWLNEDVKTAAAALPAASAMK